MINQYHDELVKAGKVDANEDFGAAKERVLDNFRNSIGEKLINSHTMPLRRVIGLLPIGELADLAEILVSIELLKERVTSITESVGGPIDVAVISKSDGVIWIKRKHYFEQKMNPRYFTRKGMSHA